MTEEQEYHFFETQKKKYFSTFALQHIEQMRIFKEGGILGMENKEWRNVSEHCLFEAVIADILAEALDANRENVVMATLLHDWYKRREVEIMKQQGPSGHEVASSQEGEFLRSVQIPENIIQLIHSNIPESADENYLRQRSREEKIIHFSDAILQGTNIVDFRERMDRKNQKPHMIAYSESLRERYQGKSLLEFNTEVSESEQEEFENALNLHSGELFEFIIKQIRQRILSA